MLYGVITLLAAAWPAPVALAQDQAPAAAVMTSDSIHSTKLYAAGGRVVVFGEPPLAYHLHMAGLSAFEYRLERGSLRRCRPVLGRSAVPR